jgi:hypothetical protein
VVSGYDLIQEELLRRLDIYSFYNHIVELKKRQDEADREN